jgi:paraquat-inducible protein B
MISSAIVKEQLDAYLAQLMPPYRAAQRTAETSRIDPDTIAVLVEDHMKKLRDLIDCECKKMFVDYARSASMAMESQLRTFLSFCQTPDGSLDTDRLASGYANLRETFTEKYRGFFSADCEETDSVFFSLAATLEDLKTESASLQQKLASIVASKPETSRQTMETETSAAKEQTVAKDKDADDKLKPAAKSEGGWISRLMSKLKPASDGYVKCDTGKDSSGMRYDPVKKR